MSRLTLITLDYPPERGGVARYLGELVKASQGEIDVIVESHHETQGPGKVSKTPLVRGAWPQWWPMVSAARRAARNGNIVLVSHVLPVGTAAMIAKLTGGGDYVVICHGLDVRLAAMSSWKRWLFHQVCVRARLVVANSHSTIADIKKLSPDIRPMLLTPGVHVTERLDRSRVRQQLGVGEQEEIVLCVARLVKRKGVDLLLEATERLDDRDSIRTIVVGDGPELVNLRQLAGHLKHPVTFVSDASDDEVAQWYASADVFCLPTRETPGDVEGFGIVYLEAAAHGLPVIVAKSGGTAEAVVNGETGVLVDPEDPRAIAMALKIVLDDTLLCERLGSQGRQRAEREFRWADRWQELSEALKLG